MSARNIFVDPMERGSVKRRRIFSLVALILTAALAVFGYIGEKKGFLKMEPSRRGIRYTFVRETETEPVTEAVDLTVGFYGIVTFSDASGEIAAQKCAKCGGIFSPETTVCPVCGDAGGLVPQTKCPVCGSLHDFDDPQCPVCAER